MLAARLYSARDLRVDEIADVPPPGDGEVTIRVRAVGICGSDLHTYIDGRIGSTTVQTPLVLGHEFGGEVIAVGANALDGMGNALRVGQRVAVDPASPCLRCEMCELGHPNLCHRLHFCGLWPDDGALREHMNWIAHSCFPVPDDITDAGAALLEPLGVALHAVDLGKLQVAKSVAILGCGPIGLLILRLAQLSGANPIYAFDCYPWRVEKAKAWGATNAWTIGDDVDPVNIIREQTLGRGIDVVFEAAWADHSISQAADMARLGGRVVLVGIPSEDKLTMKHSTARRKGLTIVMSRRMKHTYPRSIHLATAQGLNLEEIVSHRFPLREAPQAFAVNADYQDQVVKIVVDV